MAINPCYSGPNPVRDEDRPVIWRWAKANGIDQGLPLEKIHDAINAHFFGGQAKPEWIHDILSGRKTPLRDVSRAAWDAQANRRAIVSQAKNLYKDYQMPAAARMARKLFEIPRSIVTFFHGIVFPVTHGGDLAMRPDSWGPFLRNTYDNWTKSWSKATTERIMDGMRRDPLYQMAADAGLQIKEGRPVGILTGPGGAPNQFNVLARLKNWSDAQAERSYQFLQKLRFDVWKQQFERWANPATMSAVQLKGVAEQLADWANHATGTTKINIPFGAEIMFGPKLTASKISRVVSDPLKTAATFANWKNATPGEKAAAMTRIYGATQFAATSVGFLALNQALLNLFGLSQKVNATNPFQSDFMKFKGFGVEASVGGLHSEVALLAKVLGLKFADDKMLKETYPFGKGKGEHLGAYLGQYAGGKASPMIQRIKEFATDEDFMGRPMPWSAKPGTEKHPRLSWGEYLGSIGPIPLSGVTRYVYDEFRKRGSSVSDSASIIKALIIAGLSGIGLHAQEDVEKAPPMRARHQRAQLAR